MTAAGHEQVLTTLRAIAPGMQGALRRIADVMLTDPAAAAELSIDRLAEAADSSPASVVRLARDLGFSGYRELRFALRADLAYASGRDASNGGSAELHRDIDPTDSLDQVIAKIAFADSRAVTETCERVDTGELAAITELLSSARRVATFGVGASAFAATDLQQKLSRIGLWAAAYSDAHEGLPAASLLGEGDVAVGISHGGDTIDVVDALRIAQEAGARTVALSNTAGSPLVSLADHALLTAAQESPFRSGATASRLAQLTLVDIIFVTVAQRHHEEAGRALERTREAIAARRLDRGGRRR